MKSLSVKKAGIAYQLHNERRKRAKRMWILYIMLILPITHVIIFHYVPMYGLQIAFKEFRAADGIWGSEWNNFRNFRILFAGATFPKVFLNTLYISVMRIIVGFPAPIIFALFLNEIGNIKYKKVVQTISYLPHFISWVILAGVVEEVLSPSRGIVNSLRVALGLESIYFLATPSLFVPILLLTDVWKGIGWGAIIYLAAMSNINPTLYAAASVDGANRFQKAWHITIPGLMPMIVILYILRLGRIMNAGFDQIFNLMNYKVLTVAEIIDTYVYRIGLKDMRFDLATAVGLFKNVIGVTLIVVSNAVIKRHSDHGIW